MISIIHSHYQSHQLTLLREWFQKEWGDIDPFFGASDDLPVPAPLLLLNNNELIGGLAFTRAVKPNSKETAVWVNALLVLAEYRGNGFASQLVQAALTQAQGIGIDHLYVYTAVYGLYQKQGWQVVEQKGEDTVLTIQVTI